MYALTNGLVLETIHGEYTPAAIHSDRIPDGYLRSSRGMTGELCDSGCRFRRQITLVSISFMKTSTAGRSSTRKYCHVRRVHAVRDLLRGQLGQRHDRTVTDAVFEARVVVVA